MAAIAAGADGVHVEVHALVAQVPARRQHPGEQRLRDASAAPLADDADQPDIGVRVALRIPVPLVDVGADKADHALDLPRKLQIEFSGVVQARTDEQGGEFTSDAIWGIFRDEYLPSDTETEKWGRFELQSTRTSSRLAGAVELTVDLRDGESVSEATATGNGPIAAFLTMMRDHGIDVTLYDYVEHALSASGDAQAASYVELQVGDRRLWGVGIDADISTASLKAVVSAVNRAIRTSTSDRQLAGV